MRTKNLPVYLLWIISVVTVWPPPAFSMDLVFKDLRYSFQTLRTMGYAVSGGADVGEVLKTVYVIKEGDEESWYREWLKTAQQRESAAEDFIRKDRRNSARQEFLKASNYYRTAEFFLPKSPADPRILPTWKKSRDTFQRAARLSEQPILPVKIPFEGNTLPGYLCLVDNSGIRRPLLIIHSGFDGTAEELYFEAGIFAVKRGYNVLLFEGPGQGGVIREQKLPFRYNWETVVTPVVDYALRLKVVDRKRIALLGISFGGYLAPRAVAFEKRIKACIANGGIYDFFEANRLPAEYTRLLDSDEGAAEFDAEVYQRMKGDPSFRWLVGNGLFTFKAASPSEWLRMTRAYSMKGVAGKITCPMLIVDSEGDKDLPGQAPKLYEAIKAKKDFLLFTREEGAEEHCQMGAILLSTAKILDWLDTIMKK
jgi:pimeloyl-ACP methyl ester carboxylesterase